MDGFRQILSPDERDTDIDCRALLRLRAYRDVASNQPGALLHADETEPAVLMGTRNIKSNTVICH